MIYLLYGPDTYSSRAKLRELYDTFIKKHGSALGVERMDLEDSPGRVPPVGGGRSLFSKKTLLIFERPQAASKETQELLLRECRRWQKDPDTVLLVWDGALTKGNAAFLKSLSALTAKTQEFPALSPLRVSRWLANELTRRSLTLTTKERALLLRAHGIDLWALSNELEKLEAGAEVRGTEIKEERIWPLADAFLDHPRQALPLLEEVLSQGEEPVVVLGALGASLHNLFLIWRASASQKFKILTASLHPYAVKKNAARASRMDTASFRRYFERLLSADFRIKTGKLPPALGLIKLLVEKSSRP